MPRPLHPSLAPFALALLASAVPGRAHAEPNQVADQTGAVPPPPAPVNGESLTQQTSSTGPAERFGKKGHIAVGSDAALVTENTVVSGVSGSVTQIQLQPTADYFIVQSVSIGGFAETDYTANPGGHQYTLGVGARGGYNFTFSDLVSLWPKLGLSVDYTNTTTNVSTVTSSGSPTGATASTTTSTGVNLAINAFVPLMFHPVAHFFCGFGPFADVDLTGSNRATTWGGKISIGGWFL